MDVFGELMAELRQDKGLTQKELGRILSVSTGTISNYENGVHYPDLDKLVQLADFFQVSTDYLLGRQERPAPAGVPGFRLPQDESTLKLIRSFSHLPDDRRRALALIIDDLEKAMPRDNHGNEGGSK